MKLFIFASLLAAASCVQFAVQDADKTPCILLDVDGELSLSAKDGNDTYTKKLTVAAVPQSSVTGACADANATSAVMKVDFGKDVGLWELTFFKASNASDPVTMTQAFTFTPGLLFNESSLTSNETVTSDQGSPIPLAAEDKSFLCKAQLSVPFGKAPFEGVEYSLTQEISNLQVQAFNLDNGTFSDATECQQDATTTPAPSNTTTPTPSNTTSSEPGPDTTTPEPAPTTTVPPPSTPNTFAVNGTVGNGTETCIVFKATIIFNNFTYTKEDNSTGTINDIFVPLFNATSGGVTFNGTCGGKNATSQTLNIFFRGNWSLALKFARSAADASMLSATNDYSLQDVSLTYYLDSDVFVDVAAADAGAMRKASQTNMTDFLKGQVGGSYKCSADLSQSLDTGVAMETTDLQYKAFNTDDNQDFSDDNLSECPGDDESNSIVPIAVGAALAGLVVIVLIAYLIGRRRSRRSGYESV